MANTIQYKLEGTSTTYGQNVVPINNPVLGSSTPPTDHATSNGGVFQGAEANVSSLNKSLPFALSNPGIVPADLTVSVSENTPGNTTDSVDSSNRALSKALSSVIFAAFNGSATAVVPYGSLTFLPNQEVNVTRSIVSSFSNIASNMMETLLIKGSVIKSRSDQQLALQHCVYIDSPIVLRSLASDAVEINLLQVPDLDANLVYNFFSANETDIVSQEDPSQDPLLKQRPVEVPRYVDITWDPVVIMNQLSGMQGDYVKNKNLRNQMFGQLGGVQSKNSTNLQNSVEKSRKRKKPVVKDGVPINITDIQNIEKGFQSLSNDAMFANTVTVTVETSNQPNVITSVPVVAPPPVSSGGNAVSPISSNPAPSGFSANNPPVARGPQP